MAPVALMVAHCAGMVDLISLPVWVGALMTKYALDPQEAGALVTLFLIGAVISSLYVAPRIRRWPTRMMASASYALAALCLFGVSVSESYFLMAACHAFAGVAVGAGLSLTHGVIGLSERPHRLFAMVGMALGVFGIVFMGATPAVIENAPRGTFFQILAAVMTVAAVSSSLAFPVLKTVTQQAPSQRAEPAMSTAVWMGMAGVACMSLVQALIFSFLERIGADRGFGLDVITKVLIVLGLVNLLPAVLAAWLERRWSARWVLALGPVSQAGLAMAITHSSALMGFAAPAVFFAAVMIFTHTFAFGRLAALDPSGRAVASTPAMLMVGSAIGPFLGGTLVKASGYEALGLVALCFAAVAVICLRSLSAPLPQAVPAVGH
jgi:predicted MFS family arabinose efflux permease